MKNIIKQAVDTVYKLLWLKQNDPEKYDATLQLGSRYTRSWDEPKVDVGQFPEACRSICRGLLHRIHASKVPALNPDAQVEELDFQLVNLHKLDPWIDARDKVKVKHVTTHRNVRH